MHGQAPRPVPIPTRGLVGSPRRSPPLPPPGPIGRAAPLLTNRLSIAAAPGAFGAPPLPDGRSGFGLPNLRRNICPHFYITGALGAVPVQAPHLLKALMRQEMTVSRCQVRGGIHLEQDYVGDICLGPRFNQCVFYEDDLRRR